QNGDLNQYWYSKDTIEAIAGGINDCPPRQETLSADSTNPAREVADFGSHGTAFLSTPSVYFSLGDGLRAKCKVFDLDTKWEKDPGFVQFDYAHPENIPVELRGTFQMVVVDPPFITRQVSSELLLPVEFLF
ncbi:unnamed protein product, partial [Discosporangium mesarthrocarpum]